MSAEAISGLLASAPLSAQNGFLPAESLLSAMGPVAAANSAEGGGGNWFQTVKDLVDATIDEALALTKFNVPSPPDCTDCIPKYAAALNAQTKLSQKFTKLSQDGNTALIDGVNFFTTAAAYVAEIYGKAVKAWYFGQVLDAALGAFKAAILAKFNVGELTEEAYKELIEKYEEISKAVVENSELGEKTTEVAKNAGLLPQASGKEEVDASGLLQISKAAQVASLSTSLAKLLVDSGLGKYLAGFNVFFAVVEAATGEKLNEVFEKAEKFKESEEKFKEDKKEFEKLKEEFFKKLAEYEVCLENDNKDCDQPKPKPPLVPPFVIPVPTPFGPFPLPFPGIPRFPFDPNDIIGPAGYGDQHFVPANQPLDLRDRFRKRAGRHRAGAGSRRSPNSSIRTSTRAASGWAISAGAAMRFSPPADSAFYQITIDETATLGILVQVTATIDVSTGTAMWDFLSIDPATGEKPLDASKGFLPPDDAMGIGQGFVSYTVCRAAVQTGDVIAAQATVVFRYPTADRYQPIFNTIDTGAKLGSQMPICPPHEGSPQFTLSWTPAMQNPNGSAVASYNVYVSDDGGPYLPFVLDTTATQATFTGQKGHAYTFSVWHAITPGNMQSCVRTIVTTTVGDAVQSFGGTTISPVEGQSFSGAVAAFTGTDPNGQGTDFTAMIDWGDGSSLTAGTISGSAAAGYTISGSHVYLEEGANLPLKVIVADQTDQQTTVSGLANVANAPLTAAAVSFTATEGITLSGAVATFTDADSKGNGRRLLRDDRLGRRLVDDRRNNCRQPGRRLRRDRLARLRRRRRLCGGRDDCRRRRRQRHRRERRQRVRRDAERHSRHNPRNGRRRVQRRRGDVHGRQSQRRRRRFYGPHRLGRRRHDDGRHDCRQSGRRVRRQRLARLRRGGSQFHYRHDLRRRRQHGYGALAAEIADAPLTAAGVTISTTEGAAFSGAVATFTDADPNGEVGDYTAVIQWGDGSSSAGAIAAGANGFTVSGSHAYAEEGAALPLSVVISDAGGAQATATGAAHVADAPLHMTAAAVSVPTGGAADHVLLATFTDTGGAEPVGDYAAVIDWGDGSPSEAGAIEFSGGVFQIFGSHAYTSAGAFTIGVTVKDEGGATDGLTEQASIELTAHQKYVIAVYHDVLARAPDPGGLAYLEPVARPRRRRQQRCAGDRPQRRVLRELRDQARLREIAGPRGGRFGGDLLDRTHARRADRPTTRSDAGFVGRVLRECGRNEPRLDRRDLQAAFRPRRRLQRRELLDRPTGRRPVAATGGRRHRAAARERRATDQRRLLPLSRPRRRSRRPGLLAGPVRRRPDERGRHRRLHRIGRVLQQHTK